VRDFDRLFQPVREALRRRLRFSVPRLHEVREDRVGRHLARQLSGRRAAHAVGDDEQRAALAQVVLPDLGLERRILAGQVRDEEAVLVVLARPADVGLAEHLHANGLGGTSEHAQFWHWARTPKYVLSSGARSTAVLIHWQPLARFLSVSSVSLKYACPTTNAAYALSLVLIPGAW